jgi:DNA-binding transcriptional regulator YhcF (GntR family)
VTSSVRPALRTTNLKSEIADYLREQIYGGALHAGSRLDQDGLAEQLRVSRLPVREALISLEAEGLVVTKARRGAYVASLTEAYVIDHFRIFGAVSSIAAQEATEALTAAQLDKLDGLVAGLGRTGCARCCVCSSARCRRSSTSSRRDGKRRPTPSTGRSSPPCTRATPFRATAATRAHFERNGQLAVKVLRDNGFWARPAD